MKCLICGRLSLPGAKLCLDCKSARQRAFDATVTQPLLAAAGATGRTAAVPRLLKPGQSVPDAARRAAKMALAAQARTEAANETAPVTPRSAGRLPMVLGGLLVVAALAAYFGHWFGGGRADGVTAVPERANLESPPASSVARSPASAIIPAPSPTAVAVPAASNPDVDEPTQPKPDVAKRPLHPRQEKVVAPPPPPEPPPLPQPVAVAPTPPPPVIREAPRLDPFQIMSDAIARCPRDISARVACEQRLRAQYCEGHWGAVPQCASIPYVDHGQ